MPPYLEYLRHVKPNENGNWLGWSMLQGLLRIRSYPIHNFHSITFVEIQATLLACSSIHSIVHDYAP